MCLLVRQGEQAWLLGAQGNHEFARAFYMSPRPGEPVQYIVRDGKARVGGQSDLTHIAVDAGGATFQWSCGRTSWIPSDYFQVTYRS